MNVIWNTTEFAESGQSVLKDISFQFNNFEKIAIIGRVGCGKSTLFNALLKEAYI